MQLTGVLPTVKIVPVLCIIACNRSSKQFLVLQFCRLFSGALRHRPFSADQLEAALLEPDEHPMFLGELLYKLLKKERDEAYTEKAAFSWEPMLVRKLDAQWPQAFTAHPMANSDFYSINALSRVGTTPLLAHLMFKHMPGSTGRQPLCCADEHFVRPVRVEAG